jgi:hypothetical protein
MTNFVGLGTALSQAGIDAAASACNCPQPELWAVISTETSGCGYLRDRRPKILFERHIFSRLTDGVFDADDPDVSQPTAGGYGPSGAHQYDRLAAAIQLNEDAALQSASWGLGQILGENCKATGFAQAADMVKDMVESEDKQLLAMANFLKSRRLDDLLRAHNWAGFARQYNGPNYAANNYDGHLETFYAKYASSPPPDLKVRAAQIYLNYVGLLSGGVDGVAGPTTAGAVRTFQSSTGAPQTGLIDDALIDALIARVGSL